MEQFLNNYFSIIRLPRPLSGQESTCQCRTCGFIPWIRKIPWRRKWLPNPVFLPGESHGQSNQFSPWDRKGSDTTEWLKSNLSRPREIPPGEGMECALCSCPSARERSAQPRCLMHIISKEILWNKYNRMKPETQKPVGWHSAVSRRNRAHFIERAFHSAVLAVLIIPQSVWDEYILGDVMVKLMKVGAYFI